MWITHGGRFENDNNSVSFSEAYDLMTKFGPKRGKKDCTKKVVMKTLEINESSYFGFGKEVMKVLDIRPYERARFYAELKKYEKERN